MRALLFFVICSLGCAFLTPFRQITCPSRRGGTRRSISCSALERFQKLRAIEMPPSDNVVSFLDTRRRQRYTAADVAAAVGIPVSESRENLVQIAALLAADEKTVIEVDGSGQVAYSFPENLRAAIRRRSRLARWSGRWRGTIKPVLGKIGRVSFGAALVVNVLTVYTLISAVAASSSEDSRDGRGRSTSGGRMHAGFSFHTADVMDMIFYSDRMSYYQALREGRPPPAMGTLESIYSYVFGDGDPNLGFEEAQMAAAAAAIRTSGGVMISEELAPFFDPPLLSDNTSINVNEQWLLPAISALGGIPEVTDDGDIIYTFDDLLSSSLPIETDSAPKYERGLRGTSSAKATDVVIAEEMIPFSRAPKDKLVLASGLGVLDLAGVLVLGKMLSTRGLFPAFSRIYSPLLAYAVVYNAIPFVRNSLRERRNIAITGRNERRAMWRRRLQDGAKGVSDATLVRKLRGARDIARKRRAVEAGKFDSSDLAFSTEADDVVQGENRRRQASDELKAFDKRLRQDMKPSQESAPTQSASSAGENSSENR